MSDSALVLQCGGPTAVVNTSLAALVRRWRVLAPGRALHAGRGGLRALGDGDWLPPGVMDEAWLRAAETTSGMVLGGGRDRLTGAGVEGAVERLASRGVGTLFLIGGNGTMAAGRALAGCAERLGTRLDVVGIPKTIDNDIPGTDVTPGFPSAARFLIECVRDVAADAGSMRGYEDVVLVETMGRHSGWLAAATWLLREGPAAAPHLVLVPEEPVVDDSFLDTVRREHARSGIVVVTVAEGVRDPAGRFLAELAGHEMERDASGQMILGRSGGPLPYLARLVRERLRLKCRLVRPDVLQRSSRAHVTDVDVWMAAESGRAAAQLASAGSGRLAVMMALTATATGWSCGPVPLEHVTGERTLPSGWRDAPGLLRGLLSGRA